LLTFWARAYRRISSAGSVPGSAELLREAQRPRDPVERRLRQRGVPARLHVEHDQLRVEPGREAPARAHQPLADRAVVDADEDALPRRPRPGDRVGAHIRPHRMVDSAGEIAEGDLAQSRQVPRAEKLLHRLGRLLGHVHLALPQALHQLVR